LEPGHVSPAPVLNRVDTAGLQQREQNCKGQLRLFVGVGGIVDDQIELVRKFISNDMLQNFPIGLRCRKVHKPAFLVGNLVT
jgi:hypothetical protein